MRIFASKRAARYALGCVALSALSLTVVAEPAHFSDLTETLNIDWRRGPSANYAAAEALQQASLNSPLDPASIPFMPLMVHGMPGVALFDVEGDGDLDVFVTNGPGRANGLLINQLADSGSLAFVDEALAAGVDTTDMDANGACAGDVDNDGDTDLLVLGRGESNRLFENLGDGTFRGAPASGLDGGMSNHVSCSFGDIDGDGLLDVAVANTFDDVNLVAIFIEPWALNQPNQLYRNIGGLQFEDVSQTSGILDMDLVPQGAGTITWAVSMVDVDLDGDTDIVWGDDQGGYPNELADPVIGIDRGFVHLAINDGSGHFTDQALNESGYSASSWMGLGFGDLDCDRRLDIFGSNFGDYHFGSMGMPYQLGEQATRHYLGLGNGQYQEGEADEGTAFGWGNAVFDADNDGDSDVVYHGGLDMVMIGLRDNPGVLLDNQSCSPANPQLVTTVAPFEGRHLQRNVRGVAIGDLDRDGFVDVVTAANWRLPAELPLIPSPASYGGVLDDSAFFVPFFVPSPKGMVWSGVALDEGDLKVEINDGVSGHEGVTVQPVGGVGLIEEGVVNRSGIGAVLSFGPWGDDEATAMMPVTGGSSHLSAHAIEGYFGLGDRHRGWIEVLWPGGVRNRLYGVKGGEIVTMPEIPCSIDSDVSSRVYLACVRGALDDYLDAGVIDRHQRARLASSALLAYYRER